MSSNVDIREFAERVERVCDYLLEKVNKDGSADVLVIQQLKDDAAHIQLEHQDQTILSGLDGFIRGLKEL